MGLTGLLSVDQLHELERELFARFGLTPVIATPEGAKINGRQSWCNVFCPTARRNPKFIAQICAVASQNMTAAAKDLRKPVIEECDIGLVKVVVPVFAGREFLGTAGGCGLLAPGGEVDTFYASRSADLPEEEVEALCREIPVMAREKAEALAGFLLARFESLTQRGLRPRIKMGSKSKLVG